jgi:ABC-2 type transport system permease protein
MNQARAILWAHLRTARNVFARGGVAWSAVIGSLWYGFWLIVSLATARLVADPSNMPILRVALNGALLLVFLYWQVVPLLMAATGASLELKKLQVYPIPSTHLFLIEAMLRITAGAEMVLLMAGLAAGLLLNSQIRWWSVVAVVLYVALNLFLAVGLKDLVARILAHKRIRELAFVALLLLAGLPQLLLFRPSGGGRGMRSASGEVWTGFPWSAASNFIHGKDPWAALAILCFWVVVAAAFGYWQFHASLSFDAQAASSSGARALRPKGLGERIFRLPSLIWRDPMAALVEKEIRFLVRSPRFRLVFLMCFTFGLIWMPLSLSRSGLWKTTLGSNYLTVVSVYALLLLSEVCFWNSFGFDRSAAQFYFLAPIPFERVLIGKNLSAAIFITLEISLVTMVCLFLGLPVTAVSLLESYSVAAVLTIFLLGAGNLLSVHQARGSNPATSFRSSAAGRVQAMLFMIYPIASIPAALAYLARWAFSSELAFFGVLALDAVAAMIVYRITLRSAAGAAERLKESMIASLSAGDGPIAG